MSRGGLRRRRAWRIGSLTRLDDSFLRMHWNKLEERGVNAFVISDVPRFDLGLFLDTEGGTTRRAVRRRWMLFAPVLILLGAAASGQGRLRDTIVFTHAPDGGPPWPVEDIYSMSGNGTHRKALTNDGHSHDPAWSPDGRRIVFINQFISK